ncbi:S-layer homology domain-containing protein [Paenibacillus rigui]|uniref:SLH domain-containing protein n=1 Tax=Paenibacillus rigui TaxID=554312 RepID=A0A229UK86_9BACL|nr:S-layer homology domain-containing protein [Paenibacillus rigui]OXM83802.1 hypothetical protein CF651_23950 [Paenibacillus rigui]
MKKSVTLLTSAALAFSLFTSTALADTATSSDYKDLSNVDQAVKAKIDTLLSKGVFEGVSSDSFGIAENMTRAQFAKVAALVFGLKVDMTIQKSGFSDVVAEDPANGWAIPYIEAARHAGLIDGMTETTFAPGDPVTLGQLDTVFLKGLGKQVNTSVSPWYADAVKQAKALGIHPSSKEGAAVATRADLVEGAYSSLPDTSKPEQPGQTEQLSIASVQANGEQAVDVKLNRAIDNSTAKLTLSRNHEEIPTKVAWSSDKNAATLTLTEDDKKLSNGIYTITLSGLEGLPSSTITKIFTIGAAGPSTTSGDYKYAILDSYNLKDVIDSGLTKQASGTSGYASQAEAENPTLSMFAKEVVITVTNKSGEEVAVSGIIQSITSSNPTVVKAAVSSDHKGYILGNKAGSANIDVIYSTIGGSTDHMTIPVQVKSSDLAADLIEARDKGSDQYVSVSNNVYSGQFNAYEAMDMKVTDNFGIEYEQDEIQSYNFALNVFFNVEDIVGDSNSGSVGTVTVDNAGIVHISGNVTDFTLVAKLPNGKSAAADIHVRKN